MKRLQTVTLAIAGFLLFGAGLVYSLGISPRTMWALSPEKSVLRILYDQTQDKGGLIFTASQKMDVQKYLPGSLHEIPVNRFVYSRAAASEEIVIAASIWHQASIQQVLMNNGWQVKRFGLLIRAARGENLPENASFRELAGKFYQAPIPARAVALVSFTPTSSNKDVQSLLGYIRWETPTRLALNLTKNSKVSKRYAFPNFQNKKLQVALPSAVLSYLPEKNTAPWETVIQKKLGFEKTHPNLRELIAKEQGVTLVMDGDNLGLGIQTQNPAAVANIFKAWFASEEAHRHPNRRAFRLPDGTIGYEKTAGAAAPAFPSEFDHENCLESLLPDLKVWLCKGESSLSLSSQKSIAQQVRSALPGATWVLQLGQEYAESLPFANLESVVASGDEAGGMLWLSFRKAKPKNRFAGP